MTHWEYYKRWMTTAGKNTTVRTGVTFATVVYSLVGMLVGSLAYVAWNGADKLHEEWSTWIAFTVVGGIALWSLAMFFMMIAAPFQMHIEDHAAHEASKRTSESDFEQCKNELLQEIAEIVRERESLKGQAEDQERRRELRELFARFRIAGVKLIKRPIPEPQDEMDEQVYILQQDADAWIEKVRSKLQRHCEARDVSRFDDPCDVNVNEMSGRNGRHKECLAMVRGRIDRLDEIIDRLDQPTSSP